MILLKGGILPSKNEYAIYLRKSREDIESEKYVEGETLARHEKILTNLASSRNLTIGKIYREVVSGETISERKEMQKLLNDVENEKWIGVLVVELERLARGDTSDQGRVLKAFKYSHTKIITPVKTYDPDNEFDEEYFEFGLFMSRREYKTINRRLQKGREISVSEGKFVGNISPFGYDRVKIKDSKGFTLSINQEEADIVKEIFRLYTFENNTIGEIARKLNSMNLKPRISTEWNVSSIRDIIANPIYIGKITWNKRKQIKKTLNGNIIITRPRNNNCLIYNGLHPHIIDNKIWKMAQEKRMHNTPNLNHDSTLKNPFAGLIFCKKCGKPMQRRPYLDNRVRLICSNRNCNNISSNFYIVENKIIISLKIWFENYEIDFVKNNYNIDPIKESVVLLKKKIEKENAKLIKLYDFLENDIYTKEEFVNRSQFIKSNISILSKDLKKNESFLENNKNTKSVKFNNIMDLYNSLETNEYKNILLKSLIHKIYYEKSKKCTSKNDNFDDFALDIYPKIHKC